MTIDTQKSSGKLQIERLETTVAQIVAFVQQPGNAQRLSVAPGENEWTVLQTLGHCVEMIPYWLRQCHMLIQANGEELPRFGRTPDSAERLAGVERGAVGNPDELIEQLKIETRNAVAEIRGWASAELAKKGMHARWGEMSVEEIIERLIVVHLEEHLKQIQDALKP
jgi:hypothetical protein